MAKLKSKYVCQKCGYETVKWLGKCPECLNWNTFVEEIEEVSSKTIQKQSQIVSSSGAKPVSINQIEDKQEDRIKTKIKELDRVLGGGIVKGSLVLVGGDPGIGKSTLLLQVSGKIAELSKKVLYVSGEESDIQIKLRASRLNIKSNNLLIYAENNLDLIEMQIKNIEPDVVVIDSIQTVFSPDVTSAQGSVSQVKEGTHRFMKVAKKIGIPVFLVGHVTKEGSLAGPRLLEHMVDTVLYFEGERYNSYRLLRAVKNRFGSTNELGVFEMRGSGLEEVQNPSKVLIAEKPKDVSGSVIVATVEGTRPMLLELQALVAPTNFGISKRTATGVDHNRVSLILAVLEKVVGMQIQNQDVYINIAGGMKVNEPSLDLGIALCVASSFRNLPIKSEIAVCGEVGLTGEIRAINFIEKRISECKKLGFEKVVIPKNNYTKDIKSIDGIEIIPVTNLKQAIYLVLNN